jgi:hypothetical protein
MNKLYEFLLGAGLLIVGVCFSVILSAAIQFLILSELHASTLLWVLFWINVPLLVSVQLGAKLLADRADAVKKELG